MSTAGIVFDRLDPDRVPVHPLHSRLATVGACLAWQLVHHHY